MSVDLAIAERDAAAMPSGDAYRAHVRNWLRENVPPGFLGDAPDASTPDLDALKSWEAAMHRGGLAGITWPVAYGGHGLTLREHLIANQEIGQLALPESVNSLGKELAGPIILAVGTEEQKRRFLPPLVAMKEIWCQGFSEPNAGSDLAGLRTRAVPDGAGWRITGQKIWTSASLYAQRCLLLARTGSVEDRHRGLALFALRMNAPGVTVRGIRQIDGKESFAEVFFDDVFVAGEDALGKPDEGWSAALRVLGIERATNRMYRAWRFRNELDHLVRACRNDTVLARLLEDGAYRRRLADTVVDIEILKGYVETFVDDLLAGEQIGARGSLMKLHWSEAHQRFVALGLEMLGAAPPGAAPAVVQTRKRFNDLYMRARAETIYAGTTEIQLGIIADRILELPKGR
jgi:alkylation response protein AidB-like acyl-CoA dehydrogenase